MDRINRTGLWVLLLSVVFIIIVVTESTLGKLLAGGVLLWIPGLAVLSLVGYLDGEVSISDVFVLPVVISLVVHLVLTLLLLTIGLSLSYALAVSFLFAGVLVLSPPQIRRLDEYHPHERWILPALLVAVAAFVLIPHWNHPRVTLSYHGAFHSAITYNIIQMGVPPTNPGFAWEPIRHYWPFHVVLAVFTETLDSPPAAVAIGLNLVAALGVIVAVRDATATLVDRSWRVTVAAPWSVFLGLSILEPVFRFGMNWTPWDIRISTFLLKFLNVNGFTLGLLLTACLLYLFSKIATGRPSESGRTILFIVCAVLMFLVHSTTALFVYTAFVVAAAISIYYRWTDGKAWKPYGRQWALAWVVTAALTVPFYVYISSIGTYGSAVSILPPTSYPLNVIILRYAYNLANFGIPYLAVSPVLFLGLWYVWRHRDRRREAVAVAAGGISIGILGAIAILDDGNQYKAAYIAILPLAPILAIGIDEVAERLPSPRYRQVSAVVLVVVLLTTPVTVAWVDYVNTPMTAENDYVFDGGDITFAPDSDLDGEPMEWIRANTPEDSAVVFDRALYERSSYAVGDTEMIFAAATQRSLFFGGDALPPEYLQYRQAPARERIRSQLVTCGSEKTVPSDMLQGPLYVVVTDTPARECSLPAEYATHDRWTRVTKSSRILVYRYE